jgi:hypothetical protein
MHNFDFVHFSAAARRPASGGTLGAQIIIFMHTFPFLHSETAQ